MKSSVSDFGTPILEVPNGKTKESRFQTEEKVNQVLQTARRRRKRTRRPEKGSSSGRAKARRSQEDARRVNCRCRTTGYGGTLAESPRRGYRAPSERPLHLSIPAMGLVSLAVHPIHTA